MKTDIYEIELISLAISLLPIVAVVLILSAWSLNSKTAIFASFRMIIQLVAIGYILTSIFSLNDPSIVVLVLVLMLLVASWIALRPLKERSSSLFFKALLSIFIGGVSTLILTTVAVLRIEYWYEPQYVIPLAGMIFSNAMNAVSLAAERFESEISIEKDFKLARNNAFTASLIPIINTFFAVGLVALPGMMTGQILSGVDPLLAVRYQIVVMSIIFGSSGISAAVYLHMLKKVH